MNVPALTHFIEVMNKIVESEETKEFLNHIGSNFEKYIHSYLKPQLKLMPGLELNLLIKALEEIIQTIFLHMQNVPNLHCVLKSMEETSAASVAIADPNPPNPIAGPQNTIVDQEQSGTDSLKRRNSSSPSPSASNKKMKNPSLDPLFMKAANGFAIDFCNLLAKEEEFSSPTVDDDREIHSNYNYDMIYSQEKKLQEMKDEKSKKEYLSYHRQKGLFDYLSSLKGDPDKMMKKFGFKVKKDISDQGVRLLL